ncbi:hypothetical protein [Xanthocytophaga agilis]|uniref:Uncharacterized protein n=1 Tax=Xanthocytophaga agilis TaxID=3048010 RepID=A0AAE3R003_9BACT|nr:hypothetical protein [Xanthocytophaga agilis]MDJ1500615.1 hypothetical protein [Xanthocytophaga agilis]
MNPRYKATINELLDLRKQQSIKLTNTPYIQKNIALIKTSPFYQGDSLWIDFNRRLHSNKITINSKIDSIYNQQTKMDSINQQVVAKRLPALYFIYLCASK